MEATDLLQEELAFSRQLLLFYLRIEKERGNFQSILNRTKRESYVYDKKSLSRRCSVVVMWHRCMIVIIIG